MSCPNCTCTMQGLAEGWRWCGRCGTIAHATQLAPDGHDVPVLVLRVRKLYDMMREEVGFHDFDKRAWHQIGLFEAVFPPEERPRV